MTQETSTFIDQLCINTLRGLCIDAIERAHSGHPGLPLGAAPMAYVLWQKHLRHNPADPQWPNRDRFVLSAGHGSMLLYALLHVTGYDVSLDDLKNFRQWQSRTPGHPEVHVTPGVDVTTGPLGQGAANAVGMAIAERCMAYRYNKPGCTLVDNRTYALVSDGDLMEGISAEAASLAGHLKLGKLIYLYDANGISLDGPTSLTFGEDVAMRYRSYGWQVLEITDGNNDLLAIDQALQEAQQDTTRPSLIIIHTTIGFGAPNKQNTAGVHGSPLGKIELELTKKALNLPIDQEFLVPQKAMQHFQQALTQGKRWQAAWQTTFADFAKRYPALAQEWQHAKAGTLPENWLDDVPTFSNSHEQPAMSTRAASGQVLNALAKSIPWLIGGDADLSSSTMTKLVADASFDGQSGAGRNIHFGVREHAMAAAACGMAYHGFVHPYVATFFVFSDYMKPAIRLAALGKLNITYVFTHDSIGLGEDGPTHQPIEHLMGLRSLPNFTLLRPADAEETSQAWQYAIQHRHGPVGLVLSRQNLPMIDKKSLGSHAQVQRGAYILADSTPLAPVAIIIATGSEVHIALEAQQLLKQQKIPTRVVSMPSWELFAAQDKAYQQLVLPKEVTARLAIEAGVTLGWQRWVGSSGAILGLDNFGASAKAADLYQHMGLTAANAVSMILKLLPQA